MGTEQALAFFLFALVAAGTPGPSNTLLTATGARVGVIRGLPVLLGTVAGMGLLMFIVALGLGAVLLENPAVLTIVKWCGVAFLLWLAWKIASAPAPAPTLGDDASDPRRGPDAVGELKFAHTEDADGGLTSAADGAHLASRPTLAGPVDPARSSGAAADRGVALTGQPVGPLGAAAFQWVNPKAWLVCASAVATFLGHTPGSGNAPAQAAGFTLIFITAMLLSTFPWLAFGAVLQRYLRSPGAVRVFNITMGALLALSVLLFLG